jgi:DNA-directed RNA polymerase subunit RPC12/RpoP
MRQYHCAQCHRTWNEDGIIKIPLHLDSGLETEIYECPACGSRYLEIMAEGTTKREEIFIIIIGFLSAIGALAIMGGLIYLLTKIF